MTKSLVQYFEKEKQTVLECCTTCGRCTRKCPIIPYTELADVPPQEVQKAVFEFLSTGVPNQTVFTRVFSCMECFRCVDHDCPYGLNPLHIHEIIRWEYRRRGILQQTYTDPQDREATHRVLASIQVSQADYARISTPTEPRKTRYVFFSGYNVYFQPEKLLTALDVMDLITKEYAFVPGLDFCCGNIFVYSGDIEKAEIASQRLIETLAIYQPEVVILWCPTCQSRFKTTLAHVTTFPFEVCSFPQFLARNMQKLPFKHRLCKTVTLHEACKAAFTGVDLTGAREVLQRLPGIQLREMPRHGSKTMCCGSGAIDFFPESFAMFRDDRLREAIHTRAEMLVDVCHYCHEVFVEREARYRYEIVNYVTLVAQALGIAREDTFKKYKQWGEPARILEDAAGCIATSPYSSEKIRAVVEKVFHPPLTLLPTPNPSQEGN